MVSLAAAVVNAASYKSLMQRFQISLETGHQVFDANRIYYIWKEPAGELVINAKYMQTNKLLYNTLQFL